MQRKQHINQVQRLLLRHRSKNCCVVKKNSRHILNNIQPQLKPSNLSFRFCTNAHKCLGTFDTRIALPENTFTYFKTSVIATDVPFLIG